jgi:predicted nuclease with TOPRIM domain
MAQDFEQVLKEIFGEPLSKLSQFQSDQMKRLNTRLQEMAREALKDELTRLHAEIADLRARVAKLEAERAQVAAESIQTSF